WRDSCLICPKIISTTLNSIVIDNSFSVMDPYVPVFANRPVISSSREEKRESRREPKHLRCLCLQMPGRDRLQGLMHIVRDSTAELCPRGRLKARNDMLVANSLVQITERRCKLPCFEQLRHGGVVSPQGEIG